MENAWSGQTFPHPAGRKPFIGDLIGTNPTAPLQSILRRTAGMGPLVEFRIFGLKFVFVTDAELASELMDETRFHKGRPPAIEALRAFAGDGLFTARNDEENWQLAHDLLLPSFSKQAMQGYHDVMQGAAGELLADWDSTDGPVDVAAGMTKVTMETIGRSAFSQGFGSFELDEPHPFVEAMITALKTGQRVGALNAMPGAGLLARAVERNNADQLEYVERFLDDIIDRRRADPVRHDDLLGIMLEQAHPESGKRLSDLNIRYQILTFLVAGHETTSGALSFALYYLSLHPEVLRKAQAETDAILGSDPAAVPSYDDVPRFRYLRKVLDEALRLWPTVPAFGRSPRETTTIGGRWTMTPDDWALVLLPRVHRDPAVWGPTADLFDPDRPRPKHPGAYRAFGTGVRACIGRQFALHEAVLVLARLLHAYDLTGEASYSLSISERLTLMPEDLKLTLTPRSPSAEPPRPTVRPHETTRTCPVPR